MEPKTTAKKSLAHPSKSALGKARPDAINRHRPASEKSSRGRRTSVNVFDQDLDFLEGLRVHLRAATGLRVIRDSSLVQVVCRVHGKPGPAHVAALKEVLALDGRH